MKLKEFFAELYKSSITETQLSGQSRSSGKSKWETYVVPGFDKNYVYTIDMDTDLLDTEFIPIEKLKKGTEIKIKTTKLVTKSKSSFAQVELKSGGTSGLVNISKIKKPNPKGDGVISGGGNSKEFTPDKLGLMDTKFSSAAQLVVATKSALDSKYPDEKYREVKKYLYDAISSVSGKKITLKEGYSKSFSIGKNHNASTDDIKILSKNFGEVLGGMFILKTNKKTDHIVFPNNVSQGLYDFVMYEKSQTANYYSVKSLGGSSTSLGNLDFIMSNFHDNVIFQTHKDELKVVMSLINDKSGGKTTLTNIENFYNSFLTSEKKKILSKINKISKYKAKSLSQSELDKWFKSMVATSDVDIFKATMSDIYSNVLGGSSATASSLETMYDAGSAEKFKNGYLYYPMGSNIVKWLNGQEIYVDILNKLLNFGSYIHQLTVNMHSNEFEVKISSFKESKFRFSYNGMAKSPANRPIGFKKK